MLQENVISCTSFLSFVYIKNFRVILESRVHVDNINTQVLKKYGKNLCKLNKELFRSIAK